MTPGDLVDHRFTIERLAGAGGMGAVYRAHDSQTGGPVALKVLLGTPRVEDELRFEREALALAELDHPGIVRHMAHGLTANGRPYLAMEWIEGETLAARLQCGPLSVVETMTLGIRLAEALGAAHARGVVHRDLKPSNVLLAGGALAGARIVDFGLATFPNAIRATVSGAVLGTPAYMAPEQARGARDLDARADIFALGCILHECLAGRGAFEGMHVMAVLAKIVFEEVPHLRDLGCAVPAALDELIARMLSKDPAARPADGGEVATALAVLQTVLEAALQARPPEAPSLTRAEQRLLCIVLLKAPPGALLDAMADALSGPEALVPRAALAAVEARGGRLVVLADGTVAVTAHRRGLATDQAALVAGCAIALHAALPGWAVAIATGRAEVEVTRPVGDAIERAAQRIGAQRRAPGSPPIGLDAVTAGLLEPRFDVAAGALGLELRGEREVAEAARTLLGRPTTFVGRDREVVTFEALFDECVDRPAARAVVVTAPAGVGKSRLRHELTERLRRRGGVEVWIARGDPMRAGASFGLLAPLIRHTARLVDGEPVETRREKLLARVSRNVPVSDRLRVAEFLGELTGTHFPDDGRLELRAARQDPQLLGDQMRRAWVDFVDAETDAQPLVIVLEDLHWGDAPSANYVDVTLRLLRDRPLLVFALARPEVHERFPKLWHERGVQEMRLLELSRRACEQLTREVLGERATSEIVAQLWERSAGNAFFLEELLRATAEGRADELPETMRAMVESRLDALDPEDRRLLRAASVFGEVFWRGGLAALLGDDGHLDERIAQLEDDEWIVRRSAASFGGEAELVFRHGMVQEAAYGMLTSDDRALGHRLAGDWLEREGKGEPASLAEHFEEGGEPVRAARFLLRVAEDALAGNDFVVAIAHAERVMTSGVSAEDRGRARLIQAEAHRYHGELAQAALAGAAAATLLLRGSAAWFHALRETIAANGRLGQFDRVSLWADEAIKCEAFADAAGARLAALAPAAGHMIFAGNKEMASRLFGEIDRSARVAGQLDSMVEARLHAINGLRAHYDRDSEGAFAHQAAALASFERAGDVRSACLSLSNIGFRYAAIGDYAEAEDILRRAQATAERLGLATIGPLALHNLGGVLEALGRLDEARAAEEAAVQAFENAGDPRLEGASRIYLSRILLASGDAAGAQAEARRVVEAAATPAPIRAGARAALSRALLAEGYIAEAAAAAREAADALEALCALEDFEATIGLAHAEALFASGARDAAKTAIAGACRRILERADRLRAPARERFLSAVADNARCLELARAWGVEVETPTR